MAKSNFDAEIRAKVADAMQGVRDEMDANYIHDLRIDVDVVSKAFREGARIYATNVFTDQPDLLRDFHKVNKVNDWRDAVLKVNGQILGSIKEIKTETAGVTLKRVSDIKNFMNLRKVILLNRDQQGLTLRFYNNEAGGALSDTKLTTFATKYRQKVWDTWFESNDALPTGIEPTSGMTPSEKGRFGQESPFAHETTVGMEAMRELGRQYEMDQSLDTYFEGVFATDIRTMALWDSVKETLEVEWEEVYVTNFKTGLPELKRVVTGKIVGRPQNLSNSQAGDWINLRSDFLGKLKTFLENAKPFSKDSAFDFEASIPYRKQLARAAGEKIVKSVVKGNKKAQVKKQTKYKTPPSRKSKAVKPKGRGVKKSVSKRISTRGKASRPQKLERKNTENLQKIAKQINKRLPAEVRRNMGKPALTNRTGRFSNSAELKSLRQTPAGISGEYSYLLNPYETFENTGSKRWPTGYNPKPLIAKSIRNLAMQYTEQKLTSLRRT